MKEQLQGSQQCLNRVNIGENEKETHAGERPGPAGPLASFLSEMGNTGTFGRNDMNCLKFQIITLSSK